MNLQKVSQLGQVYTTVGDEERPSLASQVDLALSKIDAQPKSLSWKIRAKVGDRVKWLGCG